MSHTLNQLGHRIGARGGRTREALLVALRGLLAERHLGAVRPTDVAAAAGVAPNNFYTYFKAVDEAVLMLCEAAAEPFQPLAVRLEGDWAGAEGFAIARAHLAAVCDLWRHHGPVLRVEHMLAEQGQIAFAEARVRRLRRIHLALERKIAQAHATGYHPHGLDPRLASYEVANLVESVAAGFDLLRRGDTPDAAILDTSAHIVARMVTGR